MITNNDFDSIGVDNLLDINKPAVASDIISIVDEYIELTELLFDGLNIFKSCILKHQKQHRDKFMRGFDDREKLTIPILIQTFNKSLRFELNKRTHGMYVRVGTNVKCVGLISMQVEKLIDEVDYLVKLILISTFNANDAVKQVEDLIENFESSIDNLKEIISVPKEVLFESKARLN